MLNLYPYQVEYLRHAKKNFIFDADCGTGKTVMALAHYRIHFKDKPVCIIAPASKIKEGGWQRTFEKMCPNSELKIFSYNNLPKIADNLVDHFIIYDECFSEDTEILTNSGFKLLKDLSENDKVAQFINGHIDFVKPIRYVSREYNGDMVSFNVHYGRKALLTPNHDNLLYDTMSKEYIKRKAYLPFTQRYKIPVAGKGLGDNKLSDIERIYIMTQADATIVHEKANSYSYRVQFSKENKIKRFKELMKLANIEYKQGKDREFDNSKWNTAKTFYFELKQNAKTFNNVFNYDFSYEKAVDFIEECKHWDGHVTKTNQIQYYTTIKDNADFVQYVSTVANKQATIYQYSKTDTKHKNCLRVNINDTSHKDTQRAEHKMVDYKGMVYCVEVPSGAIVVRREGAVWISGNCQKIKDSCGVWGKTAYKVCRQAAGYIFLSATPLPNNWIDAINYFKIFRLIRNKTEFLRRFAIVSMKWGYQEIIGWRNTGTLLREWQSISRRLNKEDCLDLPELTTKDVFFNVGQKYRKVLLHRFYEDIVYDSAMSWRHGLRQACTTQSKLDYLKEFLDSTKQNVVIFYNYDSELKEIRSVINKELFQCNGKLKNFPTVDFGDIKNTVTLANYKSGSEGVEFTYADIIIFFSPTESYTEYYQALGRCHRLLQTNKVTAYKFITLNTIEKDIYHALDSKQDFNFDLWETKHGKCNKKQR